MELYTYFRSSAAYRVRIALQLKGLDYKSVPIHLVRHGGEQLSQDYLALNPVGLVPVLRENQKLLTQSLAIIEYLEEKYPENAILPQDLHHRAWVRSVAQTIACEIHPVNNLRVLRYLSKQVGITEEQRLSWYKHWVGLGLTAVERMLASSPVPGRFCFGDTPTLADICLIPQIYNAQRFDCDLTQFKEIGRIVQACTALDAFSKASPEQQADAE